MTYVYIVGLIIFIAIVVTPFLQWLFDNKHDQPRF
jgi:hypothetical protein